MQAQFVRETSGDAARVVRGAIRVAEAARPIASSSRAGDAIDLPLPASGVAANVDLKRLDVEAWQAALARVQGDGARAGSAATGARRRRRWCSMPAAAPATSPMRSRLRVGELARRLAPARPTSPPACREQARALARQRRRRPARGLCRIPAGAARRRGAAPAASTPAWRDSACPRARPSSVESLLDASRRRDSRARHRRRRLRAARQAPRPARDRGDQPRRGQPRRRARMAARQAQPDDAGGAAHRHRHLGRRRRAGASAPRRAAMNFKLGARRQRRAARAARHGPRRPRRQGLAHRRGRRGRVRRSRPTTRR